MNGFFCYDGDGEYLFEWGIIQSNFSNNGTEEPDAPDGNGIYFLNRDVIGCGGGADVNIADPATTIEISETETENNWLDGIRLKEMEATIDIHDGLSNNNGQRGIYYDFSCHSGLGTVQSNQVHDNGWEGIAAFKGQDWTVAIWILGNDLEDNAAAEPDNNDFADIRRCAGIRLHGNFGGTQEFLNRELWPDFDIEYTTVANNTIEGGYTGISIEGLHPEGQDPDEWPSSIDCHNNIQFDALYQGLRLESYELSDPAWDAFDENGPVFFNNIFHNNNNGVALNGEGIWVGDDLLDGPDANIEQRFLNNLITDNGDFGINFESIVCIVKMQTGVKNISIEVKSGNFRILNQTVPLLLAIL